MDSYKPQSGGMGVSAGHEEDTFSIRGIILSLVFLVLCGGMTFLAASGLMRLFEWGEKKYFDKEPTAAQKQLSEQRGELAKREGARPKPDWYDREIDEKVLEKTFATPRLQYDDASDMQSFLGSETDRLESTGKDADGTIHIPINQAIDLLAKRGLPQVNGTFIPGPAYGALTDVSDAAQRRLNQTNAAPEKKK